MLQIFNKKKKVAHKFGQRLRQPTRSVLSLWLSLGVRKYAPAMYTGPVTAKMIADSVVAVPPVARHEDLSFNYEANKALCAHLTAGVQPNLSLIQCPDPSSIPTHTQPTHMQLKWECDRTIGGCNTWLYGGNANFYNIRVGEFRECMQAIADIADEVGTKDT